MKNERLIMLREKAGLTQEELASRIGVTQSSIAYYESGKREPSTKTAIKIARYFGVSVEWIFFTHHDNQTSYSSITA